MKQLSKAIIIFMLLFAAFLHAGYAAEQVIVVDCAKELGEVNKNVFGNNIIAYDPRTYGDSKKEYWGYADYGAGIWDPLRNAVVDSVIGLARQAGVSVLRFPGGCGSHQYKWQEAIGKKRKHFLYGLDEFLRTCELIRAEPVITISYFAGSPEDAADLVEYLNQEDNGVNPNGGIDWARERAKNGHPGSYKVKYFEIGNEIYHGDHGQIKRIAPESYAQNYLKYFEKMKQVDHSIKIGIVLNKPDWNKNVLALVKENLDFGIIHVYPKPSAVDLKGMKPKQVLENIFKQGITAQMPQLEEILQLLKDNSGRDIPLAVTEYNIGMTANNPFPIRHSLAAALVNAELLRIFMMPQNNILLASYWQFSNSFWGMVSNDFDGTERSLYKPYFKRPNYYCFELYNKHFGDSLLYAQGSRDLSVNASRSRDGKKIYLMVINKNLNDPVNASMELKNFKALGSMHCWVLNGPDISSTNEDNHSNVAIAHRKEKPVKAGPIEFTFQPHSLTAVEITGE